MKQTRTYFTQRDLIARVRQSLDDSLARHTVSQVSCFNFSNLDCLMSGLSLFTFKFPPLLQFDRARITATPLLAAALVHPSQKVVYPFAPQPIMTTDGSKKNDCERNALKRWVSDFRREHPHRKPLLAPYIACIMKEDVSCFKIDFIKIEIIEYHLFILPKW